MSLSHTALTAPVVSVGYSGSALVGSTDYALFCNMTIPLSTGTIPLFIVSGTWRYPSGTVQDFLVTEIPTDVDDLKFSVDYHSLLSTMMMRVTIPARLTTLWVELGLL